MNTRYAVWTWYHGPKGRTYRQVSGVVNGRTEGEYLLERYRAEKTHDENAELCVSTNGGAFIPVVSGGLL